MHSPLASSTPRLHARAAQPAVPRSLREPSRAPACTPPYTPAYASAALRAPLLAHAMPRPCTCCSPVPRTSSPAARPAPPARAPAVPNVLNCLVLQSQYNFCTAIQFLSLTQLPQSQYKQRIAIHFLLSLSTTCHDTIWIVS